jgi:hypothetical protein
MKRIQGVFSRSDKLNIKAIEQSPWLKTTLSKQGTDMVKILISGAFIEGIVKAKNLLEG